MKKNLTALIVLIALSSIAFAAPSEISEFLESAADSILEFFSELSRNLVFLGMMWNKTNAMKYEVYDNLPAFLLKELPLDNAGILGITGYFIKMLQPLYVTAMILVGAYLIFFSSSPQGRSGSKAMLLNLFVGMIIISLTIPIIQLLSTASIVLTGNILAQGPLSIGFTYKKAVDYVNYRNSEVMWSNIAVSIPFFALSLLLATGVFMVLAARYFILIFLSALFPLSVFLSLFGPTKNLGWTLIKHLVYWMFLPAGYALALVTITVGIQSLEIYTPDISSMLNLTGTLLLIASPLLMFRLMGWVTVLITPSAAFMEAAYSLTTAGETVKKTEAKETGTAVGMRGYERSRKKKKAEEEAPAAVGMKGYKTAGEAMKEEEEAGPVTTGIQPVAAKAGEEAAPGEIIHSRQISGIPADIRRKTPIVVIPPRGMPSVSMELYAGETETLNLIIRNDSEEPLRNVTVYDIDLESTGLTMTYSENLFTLQPGEEKLLKIKIETTREVKKKTYEGTLIFKTDLGVQSMVDVTLRAKEPRKETAGTEAKSAIRFGQRPKKAEEKAAKKEEKTAPRGAATAIRPGAKPSTAEEKKKRIKYLLEHEGEIDEDATILSMFGTTKAPPTKEEKIREMLKEEQAAKDKKKKTEEKKETFTGRLPGMAPTMHIRSEVEETRPAAEPAKETPKPVIEEEAAPAKKPDQSMPPRRQEISRKQAEEPTEKQHMRLEPLYIRKPITSPAKPHQEGRLMKREKRKIKYRALKGAV